MIPVIALLLGTISARLAGFAGVDALDSWQMSVRAGLAVMLLLTGSAHWGSRRADLIAMVPDRFPRPGLLVTLTGALELAGAAGLLISRTAPYAAVGLALLFVAMFPANVSAARRGLTLNGRPVTPLPQRTAMQGLFLAAASPRPSSPSRKTRPMPALPWINVDTADHDADLTILASRLQLRSHRHVPRFLWHTWLVHRRLARSPGLVAYSIDARLLGKTFWTVSAWANRSDLGAFDRSSPHRAAKKAIRPAMLPSTFVMWTCHPAALPITWQEVRGRVEAAGAGAEERIAVR